MTSIEAGQFGMSGIEFDYLFLASQRAVAQRIVLHLFKKYADRRN